MARKTRALQTRVKRRKAKGGNIYATTMRAQRTMEQIVADVNSVIATLAELSTELQRSIQPGHPDAELIEIARAENRQARRDPGYAAAHGNALAPGNAFGNAPAAGNALAPGNALGNAPAAGNVPAAGHVLGNAPAAGHVLGNAPIPINEWNHPHHMAYPWRFEGRNYLRAGEYIYEVPPNPNANVAEVFVGRYLPAERRINRNAEEPDFD